MMQASPGKFKGLLKRAVSIEVVAIQMKAALELTERSIWAAKIMPDVRHTSEEEHGCLICGVSFATYQAWGAHAARAHGYRTKQFLYTAGTQCQACGRRYSCQQRLTAHLRDSGSCLGVVEGLFRAGLLQAQCSEVRHRQAPPTSGAPGFQGVVEPCMCHGLLDELRRTEWADADALLSAVGAHVQPLPMLKRTLKVALEGELRPEARGLLQRLFDSRSAAGRGATTRSWCLFRPYDSSSLVAECW